MFNLFYKNMKTFIVFLLIASIFSMKFSDLFKGCTSVSDVTSPVKVSNNGFLKPRDSMEKNRKTYAQSKANSQH